MKVPSEAQVRELLASVPRRYLDAIVRELANATSDLELRNAFVAVTMRLLGLLSAVKETPGRAG